MYQPTYPAPIERRSFLHPYCVPLIQPTKPSECRSCGTRNVGNETQCVGCGSSLDEQATATPAPNESLGQTIGGFHVIEELGRGSMGSVYGVSRPDAGTDDHGGALALKVLHSHLASDPLRVKRLEREAKAAMALEHPSIARVVEFGEDGTHGPFIVMERLRGENLLERTHRAPLSPEQACQVFDQVLSALAHAHSRNIVHRDLKAENIVVHQDERGVVAKVCDFGMVKMLDEEGTAITAEGLVCGTPEYMSPEQARGEELDGRSDIYALGCLLFLVLTGRLPFRGTSALETLGQQLTRPVPSARRARPERKIPRRLDEVARTAMEKSPADRYQSASEMRMAVMDAAQHLEDQQERPLKQKQHGRWIAVLLFTLALLLGWALMR